VAPFALDSALTFAIRAGGFFSVTLSHYVTSSFTRRIVAAWAKPKRRQKKAYLEFLFKLYELVHTEPFVIWTSRHR
jgi:hypothetical protein